jgi:hypothetical protein
MLCVEGHGLLLPPDWPMRHLQPNIAAGAGASLYSRHLQPTPPNLAHSEGSCSRTPWYGLVGPSNRMAPPGGLHPIRAMGGAIAEWIRVRRSHCTPESRFKSTHPLSRWIARPFAPAGLACNGSAGRWVADRHQIRCAIYAIYTFGRWSLWRSLSPRRPRCARCTRLMAVDGWRMADGGWRMADGGWRMADGGRRMADAEPCPPRPCLVWRTRSLGSSRCSGTLYSAERRQGVSG